jgi:uncharacterized protein YdaU (DUF1376 family)
MPQPPSFPFYPADWLLGTLTFSLAEDGAYLRLVMHQWNAGSVPGDDLAAIAKILRVTEREARSLWAVVHTKFVRGTDGGWRNQRLERQRDEKVRYHEAQAANGRASAATRRQRKVNQTATTVPTVVDERLERSDQPDSNLSLALALVSGPNGPEEPRAPGISVTVGSPDQPRRQRHGDPFGMKPSPHGVLVPVGEGRAFTLPEAWTKQARGKHGLSADAMEAFGLHLGRVIAGGEPVPDGREYFPWLDRHLGAYRAQTGPRPNDGFRPAQEFIDEQNRIAATIPDRTPEQVRALLGRGPKVSHG